MAYATVLNDTVLVPACLCYSASSCMLVLQYMALVNASMQHLFPQVYVDLAVSTRQ